MSTNIVCWGDSLTYGTGATHGSTDFPTVLAGLLGRTVSNQGVPGETSAQITTRMVADVAHVNDICIIWMGTNDGAYTDAAAQFASCVTHLATNTKYILMPRMNRAYENYPLTAHDDIVTASRLLGTTYPGHLFDVREFIVFRYSGASEYIYHAQDIPPASLLADTIHLTAAGYALVAAQLANIITVKGW